MDIKMLSLGEMISEVSDENGFLFSNCYFDRMNLKSIPVTGASEKIFDFSSIDDLRKEFSDVFHLRDSLLLVSEEEPNDSFDFSTNLYASLINLPMWNEKIIKDSSTYVTMRNTIKSLICEMIDSNVARLYNAFEYCDYVLLCDASKVSLSDYMKLVNKIRELTVICKKNAIKAVQNIITVFGHGEDNIKFQDGIKDKLCLTVGLSFKSASCFEQFKKIIREKGFFRDTVFFTQVFGQYDYIIGWKDISYEEFNCISIIINNNKELLLNWRVYIGSSDENSLLTSDLADDRLNSTAISELSGLPLLNCDFLKKAPIESHLTHVISDIDYSLKLLLNRGLSQYYVLSFYESFYSFVSYLRKLSQKHIETPKTIEESKNNKIISEKIYDMFRTYFGVLNALNECTTHSRKQFLQIAPCQMMYFDAPPKLIAFYTAIINRIVKSLNFDIKDKYTFLITPDFKKDVFVDSLTEDKTVGEEHNLLIIHMSEESMYNIIPTLKIVVHEIFHHIGQTKEFRHHRSRSYLKCCLACMIANCLPEELYSNMDENEKYKFLIDFVDKLYNEIFTDKDYFFPLGEWFVRSGLEYKNEEIVYYSDYLISTLVEYINYLFLDRNKSVSIIYNVLNSLCSKEYSIPYVDFWNIDDMSGEDEAVLKEFTLKNHSLTIQDSLEYWIMQNNTEDHYSVIQYVFRESFADAKMLMLISDKENYTNVYRDTLGKPISNEDIIRKAVIIKCFASNEFDQQEVETFKELMCQEDMVGLFYLYLRDEVASYLCRYDEPKSIRHIKTKQRINEIFNALSNNNVNEFIAKMDEEIFNYRKLLIDQKDNL